MSDSLEPSEAVQLLSWMQPMVDHINRGPYDKTGLNAAVIPVSAVTDLLAAHSLCVAIVEDE